MKSSRTILCQVCQTDITDLDLEGRQVHYNQCIDGTTGPTDATPEEDITLCQVCQKDISHLNSTRKMQHINRCADQVIVSRVLFTLYVLQSIVFSVSEKMSMLMIQRIFATFLASFFQCICI